MKYKIKANKLNPGFTYLFEWEDGSKFEGIYLRKNLDKPNILLFKAISFDTTAPVFVPKDETLQECVWFNDFSWDNVKDIFETDKPEFVKPVYDKKEHFAAALVYDALEMHGLDFCPKCGKQGKMIKTAIICDVHGIYGGF